MPGRGQQQQYWHGEGILPRGPYDRAYRKGPLFDRLKKHLIDNNIELSDTVQFDIYNNNPWLWKINPKKFYGYLLSAYDSNMGKQKQRGGKQTQFRGVDDDSSNGEEDETVDESFEGGPREKEQEQEREREREKPTSILTRGRFSAAVDELAQEMGEMNLVNFMLRLSGTADSGKTVNGWTVWVNDTGRLSDDGTKTLIELNMRKLLNHPSDFDQFTLFLIVHNRTGKGVILEEECPGKLFANSR